MNLQFACFLKSNSVEILQDEKKIDSVEPERFQDSILSPDDPEVVAKIKYKSAPFLSENMPRHLLALYFIAVITNELGIDLNLSFYTSFKFI